MAKDRNSESGDNQLSKMVLAGKGENHPEIFSLNLFLKPQESCSLGK